MVKGFASVTNGTDHLAEIKKQLSALAKTEVLVGIPADESTREGSAEINNAELLYVQSHGIRQQTMRAEMQDNLNKGMKYSKAHQLYIKEHGSPLWQTPPRPVLEPAIEANKDSIGRQLQAASAAALAGDTAAANSALHQAGILGASAARNWFDNPQNGWPPNTKRTIQQKGSDKPLIDTGEMRKSITYVVRGRK